MQKLTKFLNEQSGATAIEYALIAAGVALLITGAVFALGGQVSNSLMVIADAFAAL